MNQPKCIECILFFFKKEDDVRPAYRNEPAL